MGKSPKPPLAIIGGGRVGSTLGYLLRRRGYRIAAVVSRGPASARRAASFIGGTKALAEIEELPRQVELIIIAVPDSQVRRAAQALASLELTWRRVIALHTSGYLSSSALAPLAERGAAVGSFHPLQTFPEPRLAVKSLRNVVFAIEGNRKAMSMARRLARDLGGHAVPIDAENKALYHAAAALASGHLAALFAVAAEAIAKTGRAGERLKAGLLTLSRATLDAIEALGFPEALTGPIVRGDVETVSAHIDALAQIDPTAAELYRLLGTRLLMMVWQNIPEEKAEALSRILGSPWRGRNCQRSRRALR